MSDLPKSYVPRLEDDPYKAQFVVAMYVGGVSTRQIRRWLKVGPAAMYRVLARAGVKTKRTSQEVYSAQKAKLRDKMYADYNRFLSYKQVAAKHGVPYTTARHAIVQAKKERGLTGVQLLAHFRCYEHRPKTRKRKQT